MRKSKEPASATHANGTKRPHYHVRASKDSTSTTEITASQEKKQDTSASSERKTPSIDTSSTQGSTVKQEDAQAKSSEYTVSGKDGVEVAQKTTERRRKEKWRRSRSASLWKIDVKKRCKYQCAICHQPEYPNKPLEVHHIWPLSERWGLRSHPYNGVALCTECHKWVESGAGQCWNMELRRRFEVNR